METVSEVKVRCLLNAVRVVIGHELIRLKNRMRRKRYRYTVDEWMNGLRTDK